MTFRPRLSDSAHQRAWALLQAVPERRRGDYIVQAILCMQEQEHLENLLRKVLREELQHRSWQPVKQQAVEPVQPQVPEQMLGFLQSL